MLPKKHAVVSGVAASGSALYLGLEPVNVLTWTFIGVLSGVFIDVDHLPLAAVFNGKRSEALKWFKNPFRAVTEPENLLDDIDPERELRFHRLASHFVVLAAAYYFYTIYSWAAPVVIGVAAHIAADIAYDLYRTRPKIL